MTKNELIKPEWGVSDRVKILVTTRNFFSQDDFNISFANNNNFKNTRDNITNLQNNFLPSHPFFVKQAHGRKIINLDTKKIHSYVADGIITSQKNQVISIQTADCMPIIISSDCGSIICALHVGRKGLEYNIINNACNILRKYNYNFEAWVGPSISKKNYVISSDIRDSFINIDDEYKEYFLKKENNLFYMDLIGIASYQLKNNDINNISCSGVCTADRNDIFYSHRLSGDRERFGTFVWLE